MKCILQQTSEKRAGGESICPPCALLACCQCACLHRQVYEQQLAPAQQGLLATDAGDVCEALTSNFFVVMAPPGTVWLAGNKLRADLAHLIDWLPMMH